VTHWIYGLGATLVILGAANLERSRTLHVPRAVVFLGEASYSIYLVHLPVISAASKLVKKLDGKAPDALLFVATAVIALDAGIIFHIAIEKPLVGLMQGLPAPQVSSG
jgi:peptidoglycan/LPS O-acetylase OafA/YrhL